MVARLLYLQASIPSFDEKHTIVSCDVSVRQKKCWASVRRDATSARCWPTINNEQKGVPMGYEEYDIEDKRNPEARARELLEMAAPARNDHDIPSNRTRAPLKQPTPQPQTYVTTKTPLGYVAGIVVGAALCATAIMAGLGVRRVVCR